MELWIRSQDKRTLVKVLGMRIDYLSEIILMGIIEGDVPKPLGVYETKERALEVLDEIQTHLLKMGTTEMLTNGNGIINGIKDYGIVYEMPKD